MPEGWQWDQTLFRGSAAYYDQGRLPYAPGYARQLAQLLGQRGEGRLLDVGCGPGTVTLALAPFFAETVGVDPDPDMLVHAARNAQRLAIANARWVEARAEDLPSTLGSFRVVLFAQSFHWTDRERVASTAFDMLEAGGHFVHISERSESPSPESSSHPPPPMDAIARLVRSYLGEVRRAGQGVLRFGTPGGERAIIEAAGFTGYRRLQVPSVGGIERSVNDIVARVFSRSDSAPHLFGDRLGEFERELRARLHAAAPAGVFTERQPDTEIWIWQRP
jgi:SAM-dependent methyltransferase